MSFSFAHILYLQRDYLDSPGFLESLVTAKHESCRIKTHSHYRVRRLPANTRNGLKGHSVIGKEQLIRASGITRGLHSAGQSTVFRVSSIDSKTALDIATFEIHYENLIDSSADRLPEDREVLLSVLRGNYPGLTIDKKGNGIDSDLNRLGYGALVTGTPVSLSDTYQDCHHLPMDQVIRSMRGLNWAYIAIAIPLPSSLIREIDSTILLETQSIHDSLQSSGRNNSRLDRYSHLVDILSARVVDGISQGMWLHLGYLLSDSSSNLSRLQASTLASFARKTPSPDPVRSIRLEEQSLYASQFYLPNDISCKSPGRITHPHPVMGLLTSEELATYLHLPTIEAPGFWVETQPTFDVTPLTEPSADTLSIGQIVDQGEVTPTTYNVSKNDFARHVFITGTTGSGKTNTLFNLLIQFDRLHIPFLIIEPTKTEYRALLNTELASSLQIFTLGNELLSPFRLNPFEVLPGTSVQSHLDYLKSVFIASFPMYGPMPYILEQCIHKVYADKGWDLVTNSCSRGQHPYSYPTLSDLHDAISDVVDSLGYDEKFNQDIKAALQTRIHSLRIGGKGKMIDVQSSIPMEFLLSKPTIIELDKVGDPDEKVFLMGMFLTQLYEYRRQMGHKEDSEIAHITVIEEAHQLLKSGISYSGYETANVTSKAIEVFTNMLAEIRAYGEGIIIADQIPLKLAPDVLKNTSLKIVHRVVSREDRVVMQGALSLNEEQTSWLASAAVGEAAVLNTGDDHSIRISVPYSKVRGFPSGEGSDELVRRHMKASVDGITARLNRYGWSGVTPGLLRRFGNLAHQVQHDRACREAFVALTLSWIINPENLVNRAPSLLQELERVNPESDTGFCLVAFIFLTDWYFDQLGGLYSSRYSLIEKAKMEYFLVVLKSIIARDHEGPLTPEELGRINAFRQLYIDVFASNEYPYKECHDICTNRTCLFRPLSLGIVAHIELDRLFADQESVAPSPATEEYFTSLSNQMFANSIHQSEQGKAFLCLYLHARLASVGKISRTNTMAFSKKG